MGMYQNMNLSEDEVKERINNILDLFEESGFKITDGGGFMTRSRWADLGKGFGSAFGLGNVLKPMHFQQKTFYEVAKEFSTEQEARDFIGSNKGIYFGNNTGSVEFDLVTRSIFKGKDADDNDIVETVYSVYRAVTKPVYLKYASVVLSDSFLGVSTLFPQGKFPELYVLREMMEKNGVGELLFESAVKLGAPDKSVTDDIKTIMQKASPSYNGAEMVNYKIPDNQLLELDNKHYGFQFNPTTQALKKVSHPTQLEYLSDLLDANEKEAGVIYKALAFINQVKYNRIKKRLETSDDINDTLKDLFDAPGSERIQHLLNDGASINTPVIEKKAIIQLSVLLRKSVVDLKMRGGKLVLQTTEGITNPSSTMYDVGKQLPSTEYLRYYRDEKGRAIAEAIVPRDLLTKEQQQIVRAGGEVLILGFRIPSTEIHSSVVIKVKDYYDKSGTNVVIIPKEVMPIQGADFDVDSLFCLVPEIMTKKYTINGIEFSKNTPIGKKAVYNNLGKITGYENDYETWNNALASALEVEEDPTVIKFLEDVQIKLATNLMIDSFIDIAVSSRNADRMMAPISKEAFVKDGEVGGEKSGLLLLGERSLISYDKTAKDPFEDKWDLTRAEDSASSHESVNEGAQLTGVFANNMKVLATLAKSAVNNKSKLGKKFIVQWTSKDSMFTLDVIRDTPLRGKNLTWQTLDTLVNLAIDNVKDQALNKFNINSKNANITSIIFALGIPVADFALLTGTSIWRRISSDEFKNLDGGLNKIAEEVYGKELWKDLRESQKKKNSANPVYTTVLSFEVLDRLIKLESQLVKSEEEQAEFKDIQIAILDAVKKWNTLGKYAKSVSEVLSSLRDSPIEVGEIEVLDGKIQSIFNIGNNKENVEMEDAEIEADEEVLELAPLKNNLQLKSLEEVEMPSTNNVLEFMNKVNNALPTLSKGSTKTYFDISNMLKNRPHIFTATRNIQTIASIISKGFFVHNPVINSFASLKTGFKLNKSTILHRAEVRREFAKFILTNLYSKTLFAVQESKQKKYRNEDDELVTVDFKLEGVRAWMESFLKDIKVLKTLDKAQYHKYANIGYKANKFLTHLLVQFDPTKKKDVLKVHSGSHFSPADSERMEQDFKELRKFHRDEDGKWTIDNTLAPTNNADEFNDLQQSFLIYNVLSSGMDYAVSGYSQYLPYSLYEKLEQKYFNVLIETINKYPNMSIESKNNLVLAFYTKLALSHLDKIGTPKVQQGDKDNADEASPIRLVQIIDKEETEGKTTKALPINKGYKLDEVSGKPVFYDLLYEVVNPTYTAVETGLTDFYMQASDNIDELDMADVNYKPEAEIESGSDIEGEKFVSFPLYIKRGEKLYVRVFNFGRSVAYQEVGKQDAVESSIITNPLTYKAGDYFSPYIRTLHSISKEITKVSKSWVDLSYELENNLPIVISSSSNIYRINAAKYKVVKLVEEDKNPYFLVEKIEDVNYQEEEPFPIPVARKPLTLGVASATAEGGILNKILEEGEKWKDAPEEENGKTITVQYKEEGTENKVTRLTDGLKGFFNTYLKRNKITKRREDYWKEKAEKKFEGKDASETITDLSISKKPLTKDEYAIALENKSMKWASIGTAAHLLMQAVTQESQALFDSFVEKAEKVIKEAGAEWEQISWILETAEGSKKSYAVRILEKVGINLDKDKLKSEVRIASKIWGIGSTIDMLVEHVDKTFSIIDFKFGRNFNTVSSPFLMKYGRQFKDIWESPKEIAKLEIMMRALILKTENPDMLFKNLIVNWVPSKYDVASYTDHSRFVEVESYLGMIKSALKEEYNKATTEEKKNTIYAKLMDLPHFEALFNYKNYIAGYSEQQNSEEVMQSGKSEESLERYLQDLRANIQYNLNPVVQASGHSPESAMKRQRLEAAYNITQKILDLKKAGVASQSQWDKDISWMTLYTGSNRDIDNPYIEIYSKLLDERKDKAYNRLFAVNMLFKKYLEPVLADYYKRSGMTPPPLVKGQQVGTGI